MIRATVPAAPSRPTTRRARALPRRALVPLFVATLVALVGTTVGPAAAAERSGDGIWVGADGVAFEPGRRSDEVAYVVRPAGSRHGGQAFARDLRRAEQYDGWTAFWEAQRAYPDGYCVVWVEVEDAGSWHESERSTACTAVAPARPAEPAPTPEPTRSAPAEAATPSPEPTRTTTPPPRPTPAAEPVPATTAPPTPTPSATAPPTPDPSPTPSRTTASASPSPAPSRTPSDVALMQGAQPPQQAVRTAVSADGEVISPLGWVAVLGTGAFLAVGGTLLLWRRLT